MSGKLRLLTLCLLLTGLTVTVISLADGRASQKTVEPEVETAVEETKTAKATIAAESTTEATTAGKEPIPEVPLAKGPMLNGPVLVTPSAPYGNRPVIEEESEEPVVVEPAFDETVDTADSDASEKAETEAAEEDVAKDESDTPDATTEKPGKDAAKTEEGDDEEEATDEEADEEEADEEDEEKATEPAKPLRQLSPEMAALRDRVRRTMATYHQQTFNTQQNTATDVMNLCLAFGCNTQVYRSDVRQKVNGITCLCWNYPCAGYEPLAICGDHIAGRIGYGMQTHPSQILAVLALSRVPADYPIRVGEDVRTVADLVEGEKLTCRSGSDMSLKLVGLAYFVAEADATWKNDVGETWSMERIIKEELGSDINTATAGGTHRLLGLGYAVQRRIGRKRAMEGQYKRAQAFVAQYIDFALKLQNSDGSWGADFLATRGTSRDQTAALRSTGHILGWLVVSLPEQQLTDPQVVKAVAYVNRALGGRKFQANLKNGGQRHMETIMHALHGLTEYDRRWFKPADPPPQPKTPEAKPAAAQQAKR